MDPDENYTHPMRKLEIFHVDRLIDPTRPNAEAAKWMEKDQKAFAKMFPSQMNVIMGGMEKLQEGPKNLKVRRTK